MCTSRGSSIPFLVTMICFGCSSTGMDRMRAATWQQICEGFHEHEKKNITECTKPHNFYKCTSRFGQVLYPRGKRERGGDDDDDNDKT